MRRALTIALVAFGMAAGAVPATAAAAGAEGGTQYEVETQVMCDTCNVPLYIAESPRADQLRREIRKLIAQGQGTEQVKATLKARYGPDILAMPEQSGFSLGAYLIPVAVALLLAAIATWLLVRWRRKGRSGPADGQPPEPGTAKDRARLDAELERFGR